MKIIAALLITLTAGTCGGPPDVGLAGSIMPGEGGPARGALTGADRPRRVHADAESSRSQSPVKAPRPATTTTTLPPVDSFAMWSRSPAVVDLQRTLGLRQVDGIYGPDTRHAHMAALGGPMQVLLDRWADLGLPAITEGTGRPGDSHEAQPTLADLIVRHFDQPDRRWAYRVVFCESSGLPHHVGSDKVSSALAVGWFQHLAKFWPERAAAAGYPGANPFDPEANVAVAAWLYYRDGARHWAPSEHCWEASE